MNDELEDSVGLLYQRANYCPHAKLLIDSRANSMKPVSEQALIRKALEMYANLSDANFKLAQNLQTQQLKPTICYAHDEKVDIRPLEPGKITIVEDPCVFPAPWIAGFCFGAGIFIGAIALRVLDQLHWRFPLCP